jgi:hypothetical protein
MCVSCMVKVASTVVNDSSTGAGLLQNCVESLAKQHALKMAAGRTLCPHAGVST